MLFWDVTACSLGGRCQGKTDVADSSELLVPIYQTTLQHIPLDHNLNTAGHDNFKSHTNNIFLCSWSVEPTADFFRILLTLYSDRLRAGRSGFYSRQGKYFSLLHSVQTGSYTFGTRGSSPAFKSGRCVKLTAHLHVMPRWRMVELYLHSPIRLSSIVLNNFAFLWIHILVHISATVFQNNMLAYGIKLM
jgi:hypothetical protein